MPTNAFLPLSIHSLYVESNANSNHSNHSKKNAEPKTILKDINLSIQSEGISVIIGANGAGKTALIKCCLQLTKPTKGSVQWQSQPSAPDITFVPQHPVLLDRSVYDNIAIPLKHNRAKATATELEERVQAALDWANIQPLTQQSALTLSSGEQQLVALARAWALKPALLFLDEPCANLDPQRFKHINTLIEQLSTSCKIVMSSHSLEQVQELAKEVILLDNGSLITQQDSITFFSSSRYTQFIGKLPASPIAE